MGTFLLLVVIIGIGLYLLKFIPMDETLKTVVKVIAIALVILYGLQIIGLWDKLNAIKI